MKQAQKQKALPDFPYMALPEKRQAPFLAEWVDLQKVFDQCNAEMSLQQSKQDNLVNACLVVCGIVVPCLCVSGIPLLLRAWIFGILTVVGALWLMTVLRYRIYKEAYWLSCRTISALYAADRSQIDETLVKYTFYRRMVGIARTFPVDKKGKVSLWKLAGRNWGRCRVYHVFETGVVVCGSGLGLPAVGPGAADRCGRDCRVDFPGRGSVLRAGLSAGAAFLL